MNCDICFEPYDHSIRKPYSLMSCPHSYCLSCLEQLPTNKCPQCNKTFKDKNPNLALLKLIPKSSYDYLKEKSLKSLIDLSEIKAVLKDKRESKLKHHETKLSLIKKIIGDETNKLINILKQNELQLVNECNKTFDEINAHLDSNKYEQNGLLQINNIDSKEKIEKNSLNKDELNCLSVKMTEIKQKFDKLLNQVENYEKSYKFIPINKISNDILIIGKIEHETVSLIGYFSF